MQTYTIIVSSVPQEFIITADSENEAITNGLLRMRRFLATPEADALPLQAHIKSHDTIS